MATLFSVQPLKALYVVLVIACEVARLPLWLVLYVSPSLRPHTKWTYEQALRIRAARSYCTHIATIRVKTELSMLPGKEGDRFIIITPPSEQEWARTYRGPTVDEEIKPESIGVVWHPKRIQKWEIASAEVVLHLHGGAYVYGNGRDFEQAWPADKWRRFGKVSHVLTPSYRLSSYRGGRFPAALQDAITSYLYLLGLGVPSSNITISGDSAGGNLALGLLRYIAEHGEAANLPWPACVWLWSPWADVSAGLDKRRFCSSPNYSTDIVGWPFANWGASTVASQNYAAEGPYLTPLGCPFPSKSPIFIAAGCLEVIYPDILQLAKELSSNNTVKLLEQENCPHDIMISGVNTGFGKEAELAATEAGEFLRSNRYTDTNSRMHWQSHSS